MCKWQLNYFVELVVVMQISWKTTGLIYALIGFRQPGDQLHCYSLNDINE